MSRSRLSRMDFHTGLCAALLLLAALAGCRRITGSLLWAGCAVLCAAAAGAVLGAFSLELRRAGDLLVRQLLAAAMLFATLLALTRSPKQALLSAALYLALMLIWLALGKAWMRRQLAPGWTLLVYDSPENLAQAREIAESRRDLIREAGRCKYVSESELDHTVQLFRIPQLVICLEKRNREVLDYCSRAGLTAFVRTERAGLRKRLDQKGLMCIRPAASKP